MLTVNIRNSHKCAFCKHWYDPTNSAITPRSPNIGLWTIKDTNQKALCQKRNQQMAATAFCSRDYECKL